MVRHSRPGNSSSSQVRREVSSRLSEESTGTKLSLTRYGYENHALVLKSKTRTLNKPSYHVDRVSNSDHMRRPKHASPSIRSTKSAHRCLRRSSPEISRWRNVNRWHKILTPARCARQDERFINIGFLPKTGIGCTGLSLEREVRVAGLSREASTCYGRMDGPCDPSFLVDALSGCGTTHFSLANVFVS